MSVLKWMMGSMALVSPLSWAAGLPELQEEIRWLQAEQYVTAATKTRERVDKSGATVTVLTRDQLRLMGARTLMDGLKRVPGFGVNQINVGVASLEVRGVKTDFSEKILFLINGHPVNNNLVNGGALLSRDDIPVSDIHAVEIVRGPGSALYGANAFVAVINVVTESGRDIDGGRVNAAAGSFDSGMINLAHGQFSGDLELAFNLNAYSTDGGQETVERDSLGQSGKTDYWQRRYEFGFQGEYQGFMFQGRYLEREAGDYLGAFNVLNDGSEQSYQEYFFEGGYQHEFSRQSYLTAKLYFDHFQFDNTWEFTPGFYFRSPIKHDRTGAELQWNHEYSDSHKLLVGAMLEHQTQYDVELWSNFGSGELVNISDTQNWNGNHRRDITAAFVQDIWDPSDNIRLIAGARFDRYSDFGNTVNPRVSVSWDWSEQYQVVASYGSAFRAPTFGELYNTNNNSVVGNPDLDPEEIDTYELSLNGAVGRRGRFRFTGFYNKIDNAIIPTVGQNSVNYSENSGQLTVAGVEVEFRTRFANGSSINMNYTYQDPDNEAQGARAAEVPLHRANLMFDYRFSRSLKGFAGVLYESSLSREPDDTRSAVPDQTSVDVALTWFSQDRNFLVTASVYNLLDESLVDPSRDVNGNEMSDFPAPGRSFMLEVEYSPY